MFAQVKKSSRNSSEENQLEMTGYTKLHHVQQLSQRQVNKENINVPTRVTHII